MVPALVGVEIEDRLDNDDISDEELVVVLRKLGKTGKEVIVAGGGPAESRLDEVFRGLSSMLMVTVRSIVIV